MFTIVVKTVCVYSANIATCRIALEVLDRVAVCLDCILLRWVHGSECFDDMPVVIDCTYYGEVCGSIALRIRCAPITVTLQAAVKQRCVVPISFYRAVCVRLIWRFFDRWPQSESCPIAYRIDLVCQIDGVS